MKSYALFQEYIWLVNTIHKAGRLTLEGKDWSGQGRRTWYMGMEWETVIKPTSDSILKTDALIDAIPEVYWTKGKAGIEVAPEIAARIESLWHDHLLNLLRLE